ncbi:MAG: heavy-metal-associated domain-containing protein, partial [Bacteroidales bacterium]|nr:heavy-metal-associated domain-containing protein [Bacteroidales bacterium]
MEALTLKTDLHCNSCVNKVEPFLSSNPDIEEYTIDLNHPDKIVSIKGKDLKGQDLISKFLDAGYHAEVTAAHKLIKIQELKTPSNSFWRNKVNWKRASFNTI